MSATPFFTPGSELADLERHIRRLRASPHAPPVDRAEHILVNIQQALFRKHEAELQIRITTSAAGFDEHRQLWQEKLDLLDQRIAESTAVLHEVVHGLRLVTFQRFAAAMGVGLCGGRSRESRARPVELGRAVLGGEGAVDLGCAHALL